MEQPYRNKGGQVEFGLKGREKFLGFQETLFPYLEFQGEFSLLKQAPPINEKQGKQ